MGGCRVRCGGIVCRSSRIRVVVERLCRMDAHARWKCGGQRTSERQVSHRTGVHAQPTKVSSMCGCERAAASSTKLTLGHTCECKSDSQYTVQTRPVQTTNATVPRGMHKSSSPLHTNRMRVDVEV